MPIPLSIKIRTGWDVQNADEIINTAYESGVSFVSIHGRTRSQGYEGKNDWDYISKIASKSQIPIIGNGDITNVDEAISLLNNSNCHGIMIGRGVLLNPILFHEIKQNLNNTSVKIDLINIINRYYEIVLQHVDQKIQGIKLAKVFQWFSLSYTNSNQFKKEIFTLKENPLNVLQYTLNHFNTNHPLNLEPQNFLMGGHG